MKRIPYDFFMGTELNPRSFDGKLDWKMFAELRISWVTLFLLTASAAAKQARSRRDAATRLSNTIGDDFLSARRDAVVFSGALTRLRARVARLGRLVADTRRALAVRERVPERRGVRPVHVGRVPREVRLDASLVERRGVPLLLLRLRLHRRPKPTRGFPPPPRLRCGRRSSPRTTSGTSRRRSGSTSERGSWARGKNARETKTKTKTTTTREVWRSRDRPGRVCPLAPGRSRNCPGPSSLTPRASRPLVAFLCSPPGSRAWPGRRTTPRTCAWRSCGRSPPAGRPRIRRRRFSTPRFF